MSGKKVVKNISVLREINQGTFNKIQLVEITFNNNQVLECISRQTRPNKPVVKKPDFIQNLYYNENPIIRNGLINRLHFSRSSANSFWATQTTDCEYTEYASRGDLSSYPIVHSEIAKIFYHLGQTVLHLHKEGVVHGDIKPANILLTDDGFGKLADLDTAHSVEQSFAEAIDTQGVDIKTPCYSAVSEC